MSETDLRLEALDAIDAPDLWEECVRRSADTEELAFEAKKARWLPRTLALALVLVLLAIGASNRWRLIEPRVVHEQANPTYDVTDPRRVVGHSSHVWIGKVVEKGGTYPLDSQGLIRTTQYRVRVLEVIKGRFARSEVLVRQPGWLDRWRNELHLFEGDPLLQVGETVLFATTTVTNGGSTYELIGYPGYKDIRIEDEQERAELTAKYKEAYRNQITVEDEQRERAGSGDT